MVTSKDSFDTEVLIVGAGPVGLTLGIDLARRGNEVTIVEMRAAGDPPSGQSNVVSARSMEAFRRLGIATAVRDAGLPGEYPNDVAIRTTATGIELGRIPIPCRNERYTAKDGPDTWWPTPEPPHRINQVYLQPVLVAAALPRRGCESAIVAAYEILRTTTMYLFARSRISATAPCGRLPRGFLLVAMEPIPRYATQSVQNW